MTHLVGWQKALLLLLPARLQLPALGPFGHNAAEKAPSARAIWARQNASV